MVNDTRSATTAGTVDKPGGPSSVQRQYDVCLECLTAVDDWMAATDWSPRVRATATRHLHYLLQYLTITTDTTVRTASREALDAWLAPTLGLSDHDVRVALLNLLAVRLGAPSLRTPFQPGSDRVRRVLEVLMWGRHQRRLTTRTRAYFDAITQDDILAAEQACLPFYRALHDSSPTRDFTGVFLESDEVIIDRVVSLNRVDRPSVVDVGCGRGRLLTSLRDRFGAARLIGTSIFTFTDEEVVQLAAQDIEPLYCAAEHIGLPDNSQDIVVSSEVIEHLRHPGALVSEIHRILKPGGVFCVTAPSRASYLYGQNPLSYIMIAVGSVVPGVLPEFHNLYAPLTPIPIVHYGFDPLDLRRRFRVRFETAEVTTTRFTALNKFRLARVAPRVPVLRKIGGLCVASGRKT